VILLDSNVVIYLRHPEFGTKIIELLADKDAQTCNIIMAEVLGFKDLNDEDTGYFKALFTSMKNHQFDARVTQAVIDIRRSLAIELPDAIIAATAMVNDLILWTHNIDDFKDIPKLQLFDPISI
jgi:predicted nucleic acid-binding protein